MVDDLNADKYLEACQHAASNPLYHWLSAAYTAPQAPKPLWVIRPHGSAPDRRLRTWRRRRSSPPASPRRNAPLLADLYPEHVLVVQGPPGTGKSHTLGLAILARAWALKSVARPFRVAVAAKTHAAVSIVLTAWRGGCRSCWPAMARTPSSTCSSTCVLPKSATTWTNWCRQVEVLLADGNDEQSAGEQWQELLTEPLLIVGGTPGGLYRLLKQGAARGRQLDWSDAYFDLVVVDEASQMNLAEALTAAAFLRDDGQFIAVGDHRQMPPILQHAGIRQPPRPGPGTPAPLPLCLSPGIRLRAHGTG